MSEGIRYAVAGSEIRASLLKLHETAKKASESVIATLNQDANQKLAREYLFLADHVDVNKVHDLTRWECQEVGLTPSAQHG